MQQGGYTDDRAEVARAARLNYVSVFVCFLPLIGATCTSCNAEAQTTTVGGGGRGVHAASGLNQDVFLPANTSFYCKHSHSHLPRGSFSARS